MALSEVEAFCQLQGNGYFWMNRDLLRRFARAILRDRAYPAAGSADEIQTETGREFNAFGGGGGADLPARPTEPGKYVLTFTLPDEEDAVGVDAWEKITEDKSYICAIPEEGEGDPEEKLVGVISFVPPPEEDP